MDQSCLSSAFNLMWRRALNNRHIKDYESGREDWSHHSFIIHFQEKIKFDPSVINELRLNRQMRSNYLFLWKWIDGGIMKAFLGGSLLFFFYEASDAGKAFIQYPPSNFPFHCRHMGSLLVKERDWSSPLLCRQSLERKMDGPAAAIHCERRALRRSAASWAIFDCPPSNQRFVIMLLKSPSAAASLISWANSFMGSCNINDGKGISFNSKPCERIDRT